MPADKYNANEPDAARSGDALDSFNEKYGPGNNRIGGGGGGARGEVAGPNHSSSNSQNRKERRRQKRRELMALQLEVETLRTALLTTPRKVANPGPIGLLGFGMTTILLNLHNTGYFPLYSVIPAMGICFGGGAQLIAGLLEFTKGNTFACVAFTSFGAFWLSLVCVWMLPNANLYGQSAVQPTTSYMLGVYLLVWGLFAFAMMICTFRMNVAICVVFVTVTLLFLLLAGGNMAGNATALKVAGYEGIICGSSALYLAFAEVLNEVWDRTILPIIPLAGVWGCCDKKNEAEEYSDGCRPDDDINSDVDNCVDKNSDNLDK